ncbi:MAG TPA: GMC family oxidoreductase [Noviherbaspirillum sp.]|uniref:GMC family oxidoreductase n=1 Tax=Noviherbaspirillum sp. TaxID=1926288 RepID=UPI002B459239|nr:GMC family oxidoreductase [Noviherbaspirillum sp.]HJV85738.1 GMC family oxidoreductase [Noviherbaspirillum sp.]
MATRLDSVDVVLVGFGWTASILAQELTDAGLQVLALERGGFRDTIPDFAPTYIQDELRYAVRHEIFEEPARETLTFRNSTNEVALPMRHLGSFLPGTGVGGAGVHWNGQTWRFLPTDFKIRSHTEQRYGKKFIPDDMTIQDWGVTYEELEPYYDKFEYLCGISGQAGNIQGKIQAGGNPFEGARKRGYPNPPLKRSFATVKFDKAAQEAGFHSFPAPAANTSQPYKNPLGVQMGQCTYCGYCEWFGCGNYSKASPQTTILPVLLKKTGFSYRTGCEVTRVNLDSSGKQARSVTYVDRQGREFEQPAELVVLCAYTTHNVHLLLLSVIGKPYNPMTNEGVVGRNYAYQITSSVDVFLNDIVNPFMGAGSLGQAVDDFNGDNFDHGPHGFIGGGYIALWTTGGRPILQHQVPKDTPKWGSAWKKAMSENYLRSASIATHGSVMSYRGSYLDLDPTYRDAYGNPLLRLTFDFHDNEHKMSDFVTDKAAMIAKAMNPRSIHVKQRNGHYSIVPYQTTHNTGGAIMGDDPKTSVVNRYLQCWDVPNLFVMGACVFPQNAGYNPTGTVGALTYWAADAIRNKYLKQRGPLVQV